MTEQQFDLDQKDFLILDCVRKHPEATVKQLGDYIKESVGEDEAIPYHTLQKRVLKLINYRVLRRQLTVDPAAFGYTLHARIDISVNQSELRKGSKPHGAKTQKALAEFIVNNLAGTDPRFKGEIFVNDIHVLLGSADLSIDVFVKDHRKLSEFVIEGVRDLPGIGNTHTATFAWSVKHGYL